MDGKRTEKLVERHILQDEARGDEEEADDKVASARFVCFHT